MSAVIKPLTKPGVHEKFFTFLMDTLGARTRASILDVGAGHGAFSQRLHEAGFTVCACDLYPEKFQYKKVECKEADITRCLPYADGCFDAIVAIEVIEHLIDHDSFFRECYRVLKKDGKLMVSTPNILSLKSRVMFLLSGFFFGFKPIDLGKSYGLSHVSSLTFDQYTYVARKNGFEVYRFAVDKYQSTSLYLLWIWVFLRLFAKISNVDFSVHNNIRILLGRKLFIAFKA